MFCRIIRSAEYREGIKRWDCECAMSGNDWGWLMAAAQNGDAMAYDQLLTEVDGWLHRYYARRLPAPMIDDAAQDALIAVHEKRHTYNPSRPFGPWLAAIARYKWIDRLRARKNASPEALSELATGDHAGAISSAAVLNQLLGSLKPAQSEAIRMVKIHGLSIAEAATRSGQSVSLVKVNIHRGLARLTKLARRDTDGET
jgi:RNA polymerase sigma-70 factor (ECF subfamily)